MKRRRMILAAILAALLPQPLRATAGNVSSTCPPPFIRTDDPVRMALINDLRSWAETNRHIHNATLLLHPALSRLTPTSATFVEFETTFDVQTSPIDFAPWIILPICEERGEAMTTPFQLPIHSGAAQAVMSPA